MPELFAPLTLIFIAVLGLAAGTFGGLLGVGGSVLMIPGLAFILVGDGNQHLYQAAAMLVNVVIAFPAALRHRKAGAMRADVLRWMLPAALVAVLFGVWLSNRAIFAGDEGGIWLGRLLAAFLVYVIAVNIRKLVQERKNGGETEEGPEKAPAIPAAGVGAAMGTVAGLLGIGGGALAVPMQQTALKLPLRSCIANSSAIICISAGLGAMYKNLSLGEHGQPIWAGLLIAALLAPTAWVGGRLGASLTHRLPLRQVRMALICVLVVAAWKMAHLPIGLS